LLAVEPQAAKPEAVELQGLEPLEAAAERLPAAVERQPAR